LVDEHHRHEHPDRHPHHPRNQGNQVRRNKNKHQGITVTLIPQRTRWEALDLLTQVHQAIRAERYGTAATLLGMDETHFIDATMDEVAQALTVRLADLGREAGIKL